MPSMLALAVLLATFGLVVAVARLTQPASVARVSRFVRRHGLRATAEDQQAIAGYLTCTRRWRTGGVVVAFVLSLGWMLPQQRIGVEVLPLLAGWLVGALIGEVRHGRRGAAGESGPSAAGGVPRWLPRVPFAAATVVATTTAIAVAVHPVSVHPAAMSPAGQGSGSILAWGAGALFCAAWVAVGNGYIVHGRAGGAAGHAMRLRSIQAMTAVGTAFMALCVAKQLDVVRSGLLGESAVAAGGIVAVLVIGAAAIALIVGNADSSPRPLPMVTVVSVALVAICVSWAGYGWRKDQPPYQPAAIQATATIRFTDLEHFDGDAGALGITGLTALVDGPGTQTFIGRVDFTTPSSGRGAGTYHVAVIDKSANTLVPMLYSRRGGGFDGTLHAVALKYPWLSAMAPVQADEGWASPGMVVSVESGAAGPVSFAGRFTDRTMSSPSDLMVVLIFTGPDSQIYWATELSTAG